MVTVVGPDAVDTENSPATSARPEPDGPMNCAM
jgi:hypothetical protein